MRPKTTRPDPGVPEATPTPPPAPWLRGYSEPKPRLFTLSPRFYGWSWRYKVRRSWWLLQEWAIPSVVCFTWGAFGAWAVTR